MRIALMADIHANREAFTACLAHAARYGVDRYVFLGDYVGYGADPAWVVDTVMEQVSRGAVALLGNHDHAIADLGERMNPNAETAIRWTRGQLGPAARAFLAARPTRAEEEDRLFIHAAGAAPATWLYVIGRDDASRCLDATSARLVFCGHVHVPVIFGSRGKGPPIRFHPVTDVAVPLLRQRRWLGVLGSVGQPRDGDPGASYAVLDTVRHELTYFRVPYDIDTAAAKIRNAGLPEALAQRLSAGR